MTKHRPRLLLAVVVLAAFLPCGAVGPARDSPALLGLEGTANRTSLWSSLRAANFCASGACHVPAGAVWVIDTSMDVETLTIEGTVRWDTSKDGLVLRAQYIYVTGHGRFEMGSEAAPMVNKATIYIKEGPQSHHEWGFRFLSGDQYAEIAIYGRPLARTWTLLSRTAEKYDMQLHLKHDPTAMGWRVGDRVGIATTSRGHSTVHKVVGLGPNLVQLETPLPSQHWGGWRQVYDQRFEMAAEVINLERNVLITGDHSDFYSTKMGLHTSIHGHGYADIRYTRLEYCGQRDVLGRYCLHFHLMGPCPRCIFKGNAIHDSQQVGVTIHGIQYAQIEENVLFDVRGAGIYTEDGNEMHNLIARNVLICSWYERCSVTWQGVIIYAGIYLIGMTNDIIENHVAGYENGIWTPGSYRGLGQGAATNRVCPQFTPFGTIRGNVNHDCWRFGMYPDNQYPRNVLRDSQGFLVDKSSCNAFTPDGQDNGANPANLIEDEFDWHCMFVGQYAMGDVRYVNYTGVNNAHSMYWKASKNFADGGKYHVVNSRFYNDPRDYIGLGKLDFMGPAGPFTFGISNTVFAGWPVVTGVLIAGQACGLMGAGGPCNVQYLLDNVNMDQVQRGRPKVAFGIHCVNQGYVLPMFITRQGDRSLGGWSSIVSKHMDGFKNVAGCESAGFEWGNGIRCGKFADPNPALQNIPIRRLNIWGFRSDTVTISGPGYENVASKDGAPVFGMNAGKMQYEPENGHGYGTPVIAGKTYELTGSWRGNLVVDFSDPLTGAHMGTPGEFITLKVGGVSCQVRASDDRRWLIPPNIVPHVIATHTSIQNGQLLCSGPSRASIGDDPPVLPSPAGKACSRLEDVMHTCRAKDAGCLVLAGKMASRTCRDYCARGSLVCAGAWQKGVKPCSKAKALSCDAAADDPADGNVLCQCEQLETTPMPSTTAPPVTTVMVDRFPECGLLENVAARCSVSGCQVLAKGMKGRSCAAYCKKSGLKCVSAKEPDDGCNAAGELSCEDVREDFSELICECGITSKPTSTTATTTTKEEHADRATFQIRNKDRGQCLLERGEGEDSLQLHKCDHMVTGQQWAVVRGRELATIRSVRGYCLEERAGKAVVALCDPDSRGQQWNRLMVRGLLKDKLDHCLRAPPTGDRISTEACLDDKSEQWDFLELRGQPVGIYDAWTPAPSSLAETEEATEDAAQQAAEDVAQDVRPHASAAGELLMEEEAEQDAVRPPAREASEWAVEASGQWAGDQPAQAMGRRRRRTRTGGLPPVLDIPSP